METCDLVDHVAELAVGKTKRTQRMKSLLMKLNQILVEGYGMEMLDARGVYGQRMLLIVRMLHIELMIAHTWN